MSHLTIKKNKKQNKTKQNKTKTKNKTKPFLSVFVVAYGLQVKIWVTPGFYYEYQYLQNLKIIVWHRRKKKKKKASSHFTLNMLFQCNNLNVYEKRNSSTPF